MCIWSESLIDEGGTSIRLGGSLENHIYCNFPHEGEVQLVFTTRHHTAEAEVVIGKP